MNDLLDIKRLDVDTPCGTVHLAAFPKGGEGVPPHREVVYKILSEYTGLEVNAAYLTLSKGLLDESSQEVGNGSAESCCEARSSSIVKTSSSREPSRPSFKNLDFDVNWTHSGNVCVVAFGARGSLTAGAGLHLGVDMEVHSPRHLRVAKRFYSPEENLHLESLDESRRLQEFYRLWCRKEAFFKCVGGSFFEGSVGRNVLENPLPAGPLQVHFVDVPWESGKSLCIAVCKD